MLLAINENIYRHVRCTCREPVYLMDRETFLICESGSEEAEYMDDPIEMPYIPRSGIMKEFIKTLPKGGRKRLLMSFSGEELEKKQGFWQYLSEDEIHEFMDFEDKYLLDCLIKWCEENSIAYYIDKKDSFIRELMQ